MPMHLSEPDDGEWAQHLKSCSECQQQWQVLRSPLQSWQVEIPSGLAQRTLERVQLQAARPSLWQRIDEALQKFARVQPTRRSLAMLSLVGLILLGKVLSPQLLRGHSQGSEVACQRNQRLLRQALQDYAQAHQGRFPAQLQQLPLKGIPECPSHRHYQYKPDGSVYHLTCPDHPQ